MPASMEDMYKTKTRYTNALELPDLSNLLEGMPEGMDVPPVAQAPLASGNLSDEESYVDASQLQVFVLSEFDLSSL